MRRLTGTRPSPAVRPGAEEQALAVLRAAHPGLAGAFTAALPRARAVGLGRLWTAMAREELGNVRAETRGGSALLHLPDGTRLSGPLAVMDPFAEQEPGLVVEGPPGTIDHPADLLAAVASAAGIPTADPTSPPTPCAGAEAGQWEDLASELAESIANHALALVGEAQRRQRLQQRLGAEPGALEWAAERAAADPGFSPLALFEQAIVDGHPLHPGARIRRGMTTEELLAYAPEWAEEVQAGIVAVARSACSKPAAPGPSTTGLLHRWHPEAATAARSHLERLGAEPDGFELLAVHPWQLARTLPTRFTEALADGRVVIVPEVAIPARPLLSLRTLAPATDRRAPHLKTAVDIRLTTAVRIVSPSSARNGPLVSALVAHACRQEKGFGGRFAPLAELAGASFVPGTDEDATLAASLGTIVRESPERALAPGEVALPTAALAARSPATGRTLLADVLGELSFEHGLTLPEAGARFLGSWCECALPPLLTLLSRWGIGLEAHGENLVVVLRGCLPVRMLYRDFGGIRICRSRLAARGAPPHLLAHLSGALPTEDEQELHTKFLFPLLETNLGQTIATLVRTAGCDPERLWRHVAGWARRTYASLAAASESADEIHQVRRDEEAFFAPDLRVKAMLRTQLSRTPHAARWVSVPNPVPGDP